MQFNCGFSRLGLLLLVGLLFPGWSWALPEQPQALTLTAAESPRALTATATENAAGLTPTAETLPHVQLSGRVRELGSSNTLRNALVELLGTTRTTETDARGHYVLETAPGTVKLRFSATGHAPVLKTLTLQAGETKTLNVSLDRVDFTSGAIVVRGKKDRPQVITTTLSQAEIKKIPGSAGDALRAVQNLPGIAIPNDLSSQLVVQGGGPGDNLYLLDNIPWPVPFHFGGILSTVNSDLLSSVDLNAAGFGVRWGNCLGAVLDAKTRAGKKDRVHAALDTNLVTTQLLVETPLGWNDASLTLAGRRSYFDLFMGPMMKRFSNSSSTGFTAFPYFWDLGGSLDLSLTPHDHIRALALGSDDILGLYLDPVDSPDPAFSGDFRMENRAFTSGLSWVNTSLPDLTSTLTPYYYQTLSANQLGTGFEINLQQDVAGIKEEAEWKLGEWLGVKHELGAGGGIEWQKYSQKIYFFRNMRDGVPSDPTGTTVSAQCINRSLYLQDRITFLPDWTLTAGVHYDKNDRIAQDVTTPRLSLEWQADPKTLWKAGWGLYDQFPGALATNPEFGNPHLSANHAEHTVVSVERKFSRELLGRVDAYYKKYYDLVVSDANESVNRGLGTAKGIEFFLREDLGEKFFGWISYAYSRSERLAPPVNEWQTYRYDQPHILTLLAHYSFTPAWSLGGKLHYNSGPLVNTLKTRYQDKNGTWRAIYSDTYDRRLDDYLRLDVRMDYAWRFEGWRLEVYLEILNLLDRSNPAGLTYSKDYSQESIVNNLPRMPYFGVEIQF